MIERLCVQIQPGTVFFFFSFLFLSVSLRTLSSSEHYTMDHLPALATLTVGSVGSDRELNSFRLAGRKFLPLSRC